MRTALSCWNFFSSRGSAVVLSVANVDSGTSRPPDPVMCSSVSWSGVSRSARATCGMTL
jgi:hypothetical protein